ncbi:MAG: hypothetical protein HS102_02375 [Planctomycetia bacterium]|nr:hypothetical protein [Planctomycetia bacterium]
MESPLLASMFSGTDAKWLRFAGSVDDVIHVHARIEVTRFDVEVDARRLELADLSFKYILSAAEVATVEGELVVSGERILESIRKQHDVRR